MKPILVLVAEDIATESPALYRLAGDYVDMYSRAGGWDGLPVRGLDVAAAGVSYPAPADVGAVVVSGSDAMVTDRAGWMVAAEAWLRGAVQAGLPVLGVCFGHQLLASALGGEVGWMATGAAYGTAVVTPTPEARNDPLLSALPPLALLQVAHSQVVTRLPGGAVPLASGPGGNFAARFGPRAWGVQFHPEFDERSMVPIVGEARNKLEAAGKSVDAAIAGLRPTPAGPALLRRFRDIALAHCGKSSQS